jgi:thiamine pyrophosphate-dependent acetolactate synthase large subunit-like protein
MTMMETRTSAPPSHEAPPPATVVAALAAMFSRLGAEQAFGVSGGAMATLWDALSSSALSVRHFRHEGGAAFAGVEACFASGRPVVLFTTTGPGLTNALTGILAAREERARLIVVSPYSSAAVRDRFAIQETTRNTLPPNFYEADGLFHFAAILHDPAQLGAIERDLQAGLARSAGFIAHLAIDTAVQRAPVAASQPPLRAKVAPAATPTRAEVEACIAALSAGPFAIWTGFGARDAAAEVAMLARRMRAPVMSTPRGKGIFPEDDPLFVGVTGLAGHDSVARFLEEWKPWRLLVLGSRMGEGASFWDRRFVTPEGFVHVDVDPSVPGRAFPEAKTLAIVADVGATLRAVLEGLRPPNGCPVRAFPHPEIDRLARRADGLVRPEALMDALQYWVVDGSDATVLAESGHSFLWTTNRLKFSQPHRYRISTSFGSMGHMAAGVVGAALAGHRKAVAVVGDGAMLMTNEINTAVKFHAPAVWVVLNDGRYGMCAQGMETLGLAADAEFPQVDFVAFARAQGARATRVDHETQLDSALAEAMAAEGPFVVDVRIDPASRAPASRRNAALAGKPAPGIERTFPLREGE